VSGPGREGPPALAPSVSPGPQRLLRESGLHATHSLLFI
jgi:hypothetical protein